MTKDPTPSKHRLLLAELVVLSIVEVGYIGLSFIYGAEWESWSFEYHLNLYMLSLHILVVITFIRAVLRQSVADSSKKTDHVLMILFLGIIGMWIWFVESSKKRSKSL